MRKQIFEHLDTHRDQIEDAFDYVVERAGRPKEEFTAERFSAHYKHVKKIAPTDLIKLLLVHVTNFTEQELMAIKRIEPEDIHRLLYACCAVAPLHPFGPEEKAVWSQEYIQRAQTRAGGLPDRLSLKRGTINWPVCGVYSLVFKDSSSSENPVVELHLAHFVASLDQLARIITNKWEIKQNWSIEDAVLQPEACGLPPLCCKDFFKNTAGFQDFVAPMFVFKPEPATENADADTQQVKRIKRANSSKTLLVCRAESSAGLPAPSAPTETSTPPVKETAQTQQTEVKVSKPQKLTAAKVKLDMFLKAKQSKRGDEADE
eukprot:5611117-Amphidinium_carterae.3